MNNIKTQTSLTMKNTLLIITIFMTIVFTNSSRAALVNDGSMTLTIIGNASPTCLSGGTYPNCIFFNVDIADTDSFFSFSGRNDFFESPIINGTGIILGTAQPFDGPIPGPGNRYQDFGKNITAIGNFLGIPLTNFTDAPIIAIDDATLDMSGWRIAWAEIPSINLGNGGAATISCGTCDFGDAFTLDYSTTIPDDDPYGFDGLSYDLHLEGIITKTSAVPVPAAIWLFGSGIFALFGFSRKTNILDYRTNHRIL